MPDVRVNGLGNSVVYTDATGYFDAGALSAGCAPPYGGYQPVRSYAISAYVPFAEFNASAPVMHGYYAHGLGFQCSPNASHITVTMQFIGGQGQLFNPEHGPVPLQDKTSFQLNLAQNEKNYLSHIDFDGDGIKDPAAYLILDESTGRYQQLMPPQTIEAATHVGIYFSSGVEADPDSGEPLPSLIRQLDRTPQFEDKGLVKSINAVDLEQTDLYVFRESNGQLVTSHKGVDRNSDDDVFNQGGNANGALAYSFLMRGPDDYWAAFSGFDDYAGWAAESKLAEPFQREVADHLRSGERLKLVAINRATGYMGTISFTSKDAGAGGDVGHILPMLTMYPPNLKIWAERVHEIKQGKQSSKDKTETNIIGNEGISLEDDLAVSIHTEWLDIDGRPLPAELEQYGYTARLAKVTTAPTPDVDALKQNGTNEFAIRPGRNLNVFKFNQKELSRHHYYVQVNPYPISEQNDFSYDLNGEDIYSPTHQNTSNPPWHGRSDMPAGSDEHDLPDLDAGTDADGNPITATHPLRYRPAHYVPFKVPLYDEQYTQIQQDLYDGALEDNPNLGIDEPEPLYRWYYRPELQFSQYDFDAKSLIVKQTDQNDNETTSSIDISEDGADFGAIFDEYTDSVELLFDLLGPELEPLPPLETEREFVLSLGGEEVLATIGKDGKVVFENPEHLNQLSEEDLLSLRLYLNGDSANVLWEYAFDGLQVLPAEGEIVELNADQAYELPPSVIGYVTTASDDPKDTYKIRWSSTGDSAPTPDLQANFEGAFASTASLGTSVGSELQFTGTLLAQSTVAKSAVFKVTDPGQADSITANISGEASVASNGSFLIQASIKDKFGNAVSDGTAVDIRAPGFKVDSDLFTTDGQVSAQLYALDSAGEFTISLSSSGAEFQTELPVADIPVSISAPSTLGLNQKSTITFTADAKDGTPVYIGNRRGKFSEDLVYIQGGKAQASFESGDFRGSGFITARIGTSVTKHDFVVVENGPATFLDTVLISDVGAAGSFSVKGKTVEYTPSTSLRLTGGTPGEAATISLLNYLDPTLPEILDYTFLRAPSSEQVADKVQGKLAELSVLEWKNTGLYFNDANSEFVVRSLSTPTDQAGLVFDLSPEANGKLLSLPGIDLIAEVQGNKLSVILGQASINDINLNMGHLNRVGIHWHDGQLVVQVNENIQKTALQNVAQLNGVLTFGEGFKGSVNRIRLYNWLAPATLMLGDGNQQGSATYDQNGIASIRVSTNPAAIAYQQQLRRTEMIAQMERPFSPLPLALAADPVDSLAANCVAPSPSSQGYLDAGAAMMEYVANCLLASELKKVKATITTSDSTIERSIALGKFLVIQQTYLSLYAIENVEHYGPECLDGAVTGNSDSGTAMTCDIITSFFLIGDIRDLVIHGYYWTTSNDEFDKTTFVFASIGVLASGAAVGVVGVPAAAFIAGAKVVAKSLKGAPVATHIADDIWDAYANKGKSMDQAIERTAPLMMITAFVVLEGESLVQIKDFVVEAIDDQEDFEAWVNYTQAFFEKAAKSTGLTAQNIPREILNVLIPAAYAGIVDDLGTPTVRTFVELMEKLIQEPFVGKVTENFRLPKEFTKAIERINNAPDSEIKGILSGADGTALRGMLLVGAVADKEGMRRLLNYQGSVNIANDTLFSSLNKLNEITDLVDKSDLPAIRKGLGKVFRQLQAGEGTTAFFKSHGAANEIYELAYRLQSGAKLKGVQVDQEISSAVRHLGRRVYDYQLKVGNAIINYDKKAWAPNDIASRLRDSLNFKAASKEDATSQFGQLYKDIVASYQDGNGNGFGKYIWVFDQRMLDAYDGNVQKMNEALADHIEDIIENNSKLKERLAIDLGFGVGDLDRVDDIYPLLTKMFEATPNVEIKG